MQESSSRPFVFTGTGTAYFRIWIINLLLSIVTIGLYSPWAKVRRLRYFYGSTLFDGSPFEFHGRPIALLKGRLIAVVLLLAYTQTAKFSFVLWLAVVALLILLFPWLLWKSLRFRLANSSYRGIRFGFDGTVRDAYLTFVPMMLMVVAPAFVLFLAQSRLDAAHPPARPPVEYFAVVAVALLLAPWFYFRLRAYQHRHARLGTALFGFDGRVRTMYAIAGKSLLIGLFFVMLGLLCGGFTAGLTWLAGNAIEAKSNVMIGIVGAATLYLVVFGSAACIRAMIQNYVWCHSGIGAERFASVASRVVLWKIEFINLILTLCTFGLFWPFAVVRSMRYRIQAISCSGDGDGLTASTDPTRAGATGEEAVDLFGLDLAL